MSKTFTARQGLSHKVTKRCYPTGCEAFNLAIGTFDPVTGRPGIPEGTVMEVFGPNASLKSALWESLVLNTLRQDPEAKAFLLLSEAFDFQRLVNLGYTDDELDRVIVWSYFNPENPTAVGFADDGINLLCDMAMTDPNLRVAVLDSIKALVFKSQVVDEKGNLLNIGSTKKVAERASKMGEFMGEWAVVNKSNAILFMINQISESIGMDFSVGKGIKPKTSGGRSKEHAAFIRVEANSSPPDQTEKPEEHALYKNKIYSYYKTIYNIVKNKYGYPFRKVYADFDHIEGYRYINESSCLDIAALLGIVTRGGPMWNFPNGDKVKGRDAAEAYLVANPEVEKALWQAIYPRHEEFFGTAKVKSVKGELDS